MNRKHVVTALLASIIQLVVFKLLYPYADYFSDSYSYISAAQMGLDVSIWPIGYSKFLALFHHITTSDTAVVAFQYLLLQGVLFYLLHTIIQYFAPAPWVVKTLFICFFFNPLHLYLSNYISSDALFLSVSLLWAIQLLQLIQRPAISIIFLHALLIVIAFTLRYNAMYYPLVSMIAYLLSHLKPAVKVAGIILPLLLITAFVIHTRNQSRALTGHAQFSVFGGWQLANNAFYMYPFIKVTATPPAGTEEFDKEVHKYFDSIPEQLKHVSPTQGAFYIKYPYAPLKYFLSLKAPGITDTTAGFQSWGAVAPVYGSYGSFLIKHHPFAFARYFLLPNTFNYFLPPLEKLEVYNTGANTVSQSAVHWFRYRSQEVKAISWTAQGWILMLFPMLFMALNLYTIWTLIRWVATRRLRSPDPLFEKCLWLMVILLAANAGFSILASPIVFRYQVFPMIICFSFLLIMSEKLLQLKV
ncbi:hypothetical protein SAMN05660909_01188 [Chitinophaga terrae (ex Kim and Jung 2007)]|uniref:Glycosyltransferase RgtA/B/C/D-like domain-containing protein n=1 Tax=Chitinophaga terrae (ex Kim and Jung 2007) TaxID=408074 RepID=A0A1H3ZFD7_9BACT|nr:hypothetical protein [Chitinophaga terrae (ex Kim and Jung 2007)]GEP88717.1 hypothetical protein CTE07_03620 [Chitinophaga terrae (ex Kim and Jung 2007)]SEA22228.1 hypothetical protein SAMN05660909_01188 [Chitinophaga terrae (ex Kim and Jung 2007)]